MAYTFEKTILSSKDAVSILLNLTMLAHSFYRISLFSGQQWQWKLYGGEMKSVLTSLGTPLQLPQGVARQKSKYWICHCLGKESNELSVELSFSWSLFSYSTQDSFSIYYQLNSGFLLTWVFFPDQRPSSTQHIESSWRVLISNREEDTE